MRFVYLLSLVILFYACGASFSTSESERKIIKQNLWSIVENKDIPSVGRAFEADKFHCYILDKAFLQDKFKSKHPIIDIPIGEELLSFQLELSNTMNPVLAQKFPEIRSYKGKSITENYTVRLDQNEKGVFVQITSVDSKILISPLLKEQSDYYAVYKEIDIPLEKRPKIFYD